MGFLKNVGETAKILSGKDRDKCEAEPKKPGVKCGKPVKPGYGHCGRMDCAQWYAVVGHGYV